MTTCPLVLTRKPVPVWVLVFSGLAGAVPGGAVAATGFAAASATEKSPAAATPNCFTFGHAIRQRRQQLRGLIELELEGVAAAQSAVIALALRNCAMSDELSGIGTWSNLSAIGTP